MKRADWVILILGVALIASIWIKLAAYWVSLQTL